jgi:hypothetical protein
VGCAATHAVVTCRRLTSGSGGGGGDGGGDGHGDCTGDGAAWWKGEPPGAAGARISHGSGGHRTAPSMDDSRYENADPLLLAAVSQSVSQSVTHTCRTTGMALFVLRQSPGAC